MSQNDTQRTLVILKPDAVQRGIVGEILTRFERAGLTLVAMKLVAPNNEHFHKHYEEIGTLISRRGQHVYDVTLAAMVESPVLAMVLEGVEAIEYVRKMVGPTDPKEAAPGTIRGDYTHVSRMQAIEHGRTLPNLLHASANPTEAAQEIELWFEPDELLEYQPPHQPTVRGRVPENP